MRCHRTKCQLLTAVFSPLSLLSLLYLLLSQILHGVLTHKKVRFGVEKNNLGFFTPSQTCAPKISAGVDGGLSGGSSVGRPGSEDLYQCQ